jgi:hypothetical protein
MSQQHFKMFAIWDKSYQSLDQLRSKYGSFANVVQQLIESYYEKQQQETKENNSSQVEGVRATTNLENHTTARQRRGSDTP